MRKWEEMAFLQCPPRPCSDLMGVNLDYPDSAVAENVK